MSTVLIERERPRAGSARQWIIIGNRVNATRRIIARCLRAIYQIAAGMVTLLVGVSIIIPKVSVLLGPDSAVPAGRRDMALIFLGIGAFFVVSGHQMFCQWAEAIWPDNKVMSAEIISRPLTRAAVGWTARGVLISTINLGGAFLAFLGGLATIVFAAGRIEQSDIVLLKVAAMQTAMRHAAVPVTAADVREQTLVFLGIGVFFFLGGLWFIYEWCEATWPPSSEP